VTYREPAGGIYLHCSDQPRAAHGIAQHLRNELGIDLDDRALQSILDRFVARDFMMTENDLYLSLGLPAYRRA
jgi:hypothetical protein